MVKNRHRHEVRANAVIQSNHEAIHHFWDRLSRLLMRYQFDDGERSAIHTAVHEALVNAIVHGNRLSESKEVRAWFTVSSERFSIRIEDQGQGFAVPPHRTRSSNMPPNETRHHGLSLMRRHMHEVLHNSKGNVVSMLRLRGVAMKREVEQLESLALGE